MARKSIDKKKNWEYQPGTLLLLLVSGVITGVLASRLGWFSPIHEISHAVTVWALGGRVHAIHWDLIEFSIEDGWRLRAVLASGALGEQLIMVVVMIWALLRSRPFLSAVGAGYVGVGMSFAHYLIEWRYLRPAWFSFWQLATMVVYILLAGVVMSYVGWLAYSAQVARGEVHGVQSRIVKAT